jgi:hypothetical protein
MWIRSTGGWFVANIAGGDAGTDAPAGAVITMSLTETISKLASP